MNEEDRPGSLEEAARNEQIQLWGDLEQAVRNALRGGWSIQCDNLAWRITSLAIFVGATPWGDVSVRLLRSGVYERILTEADIPYPPIDWEAVTLTEASIAGRLGRDGQ